MTLFDTHCHFSSPEPESILGILSRAKAAGVERILAVGGSSELNRSAVLSAQIARSNSDMPLVRCALGYDRDQVGMECPPVPEGPLSAWGEIGLDYHYSADTRDAQILLFENQLSEAVSRNLPIVVHTREADEDTLSVLRAARVRGVIHCFTGSASFAKRLLDLGFYISFSGIVTFRSAGYLRDVFRIVPDDRVLIETDSPYLAPEPVRGKTNEPANVKHVCNFLASLRGVSPELFSETVLENSISLFGKWD